MGHRGGRGTINVEFIGTVIFVAKHHRVKACRLKGRKIGPGVSHQPLDPAARVIKRRAGHCAQMHHADHRSRSAKHLPETFHAPPFMSDRVLGGSLAWNSLGPKGHSY